MSIISKKRRLIAYNYGLTMFILVTTFDATKEENIAFSISPGKILNSQFYSCRYRNSFAHYAISTIYI